MSPPAAVPSSVPSSSNNNSSSNNSSSSNNNNSNSNNHGDGIIAPAAVSSSSSATATATTTTAAAAAVHNSRPTKVAAITPVWTMSLPQVEAWARTVPSLLKINANTASTNTAVIRTTLWTNLQTALTAVAVVVPTTMQDTITTTSSTITATALATSAIKQQDDLDGPEPPHKRRKTAAQKQGPVVLQDPFRLWLHSKTATDTETTSKVIVDTTLGQVVLADEDANVPDHFGGRLSALSTGGILNGLAAVPGGLVDTAHPVAVAAAVANNKIATAADQTAQDLLVMAVQWHRSIQVRVRNDILVTTPLRIQEMLAADLELAEFASIRKRVYETVILGKGLNVQEEVDIPTAPAHALHDVEKHKKCNSCGNNAQSSFVLDRKNGDVICSNCGTVVSESLMHEGSQFRKFEGEVDRNHHGDVANPLYSNQHNMSTTLGGVSQVSGAGMGGFGSNRSKRNLETILRNAHSYTELNVSQFGRTDRRTRVGYKDKQKKEAFVNMAHVGDALNLHEAVVQRAKELFAGFRDDRELVQQFKGVIAACLCEAFEQLSQQGRAILKQEQDEVEKNAAVQNEKTKLSARAVRRNELHHAKLAGKGGLLLDLSSVQKEKATSHADNASSPKAEEKPAAAWDLEDCRSWLLEASRNIAQHWTEERNKGGPTSKKIPAGSSDELEGQLVEHSITLCEQLETELKSRTSSSHAASKRVSTPRVQDMSNLGIKWQKLGGTKTSGGRTAGQILILKTAKKLGAILKDTVAGDAIHKELRAVVGRQEERKRKDIREEASRQRFSQMKRKPWLQARAQMET